MIQVHEFLDGVVHVIHPVSAGVARVPEGISGVVIEAHLQPGLADRLQQVARQIPVGTHLHGVAVGEFGRPKRELVAMLGGQHHIAGPRVAEQLRPGAGVELLGFEHRDEVVVGKVRPPVGEVIFDRVLVNVGFAQLFRQVPASGGVRRARPA